jgi:hypothetical protein
MSVKNFGLLFFLGNISLNLKLKLGKGYFMHKFGINILSILSISFLGCEKKERVIEDYSALAEQEFISKGWVPNEIPRDFKNLILRYDLDVNKGCGRYSFINKPYILVDEAEIISNGSDQYTKALSILEKFCPEAKEDFSSSIPKVQDGFAFFENQKNGVAYFLILR